MGSHGHNEQPKSDVGGPVVFALAILATVVTIIWIMM